MKIVFWILLVAVLVLSLVPTEAPLPTTGWDKTNHLLAFSALTVIGLMAHRVHFPVGMGLLLYGGLIEVLQSFTGYRFAEWGDLLADAIGIAIGFGFWHVWRWSFRKSSVSGSTG